VLRDHAHNGQVFVDVADVHIAKPEITGLPLSPGAERLLRERPLLANGEREPTAPGESAIVDDLRKDVRTSSARAASVALNFLNLRDVNRDLLLRSGDS